MATLSISNGVICRGDCPTVCSAFSMDTYFCLPVISLVNGDFKQPEVSDETITVVAKRVTKVSDFFDGCRNYSMCGGVMLVSRFNLVN